MAQPLPTAPANLEAMRRNVASIADPVGFVTRYMRLRGFHSQRDPEELFSIAMESLVKAGLSWTDRDEGVSFTTWAYRYMDREVLREIARDRRRCQGRAIPAGGSEDLARRWRYRPGTDPYRRIEDRLHLEDLYARARLSDVQRLALELFALHGNDDGPPPTGHAALGQLGGGNSTFRTARRRIRAAIARGRLDDEWARARAANMVVT